MTLVYTLIVDATPLSHTAETTPWIGDLVTRDEAATVVRVLRSSDGGRIYVAETASDDAS